MDSWKQRLAGLYNLYPYEQDFGILNANGDHLDEYIDIFLGHQALNEWEWEELADLVFESANEVMLEGELSPEQLKRIKLILVEHKEKYPHEYDY